MADEEIQEPVQEPVAEPKNEELENLLSSLEKLGVDSPQKLQNMHTAASQSGNLANMLGEIRRENEILRQQLSQKPTYQDPYAEPAAINMQEIESVVERAIGRTIGNLTQKQMEAQANVLAEIQSIQSDDDFSVIGEQWDRVYKDPVTQAKILSGQTTPRSEYDKLVKNFYRKAIVTMRDALKQGKVSGVSTPGNSTIPHMEGQGSQPVNRLPNDKYNPREKLLEVHKKSTGTDEDIFSMFDAMIPDGDGFLKPS